ncbi:hypothetical protein [Leucobacter sp.]
MTAPRLEVHRLSKTFAGVAVQGEPFPFRRLFTQDVASGLDLTADGQSSGSWFREADYRAGFTDLWGGVTG